MHAIAIRFVRRSPLLLIVLVVWLPRTLGQLALQPYSTTRQATSTSTPTSQSIQQEKEFREGRRMIEETAAVYKNCKSYSDEGETVRGDDTRGDGERQIQAMSFKTAFVRPGRCRFDYRDVKTNQPLFIVWGNGKDIRTWWRNPLHNEKDDSLVRAFAVTMWFSGGNPYVIPALLMPQEFDGFSLTRLENIRFAEREKLGGVSYNILEADDGPLVFMRIWINADTKLVCKIVEYHTFPSWPTERTTTYKPKINVDIPAADLEFNPPKE